jgi:F-type H+-transporting ATPase subunit a
MSNSTILNSKKITKFLFCAIFLTIVGLPGFASAQAKADSAGKKFDPQPLIMEHVSDAHFWPCAIPFMEEKQLPLPVILYTDKGLETFSSSHLLPEGTIYQGKYHNYKLEGNHVLEVDATGKVDETAKPLDFSITRNVASMMFACAILLIIFLTCSKGYRKRKGKAPKGIQSFMEPLILFVRDDIALPSLGVKYPKYMPLLLSFFFFILINNLLGIVPFFPGGYNLTGNIAVTGVLAVIVLFTVNLSANKYYWKHIFKPNPWWLFPIMIPVEIVSVFSKPIALMIRLFANMIAGHIVMLSLISLIFIFGTLWISPVSVIFVVFMDIIEILVAFLQAYIFTLLSALFIGMAIEEHNHEVL